ncbi:hypothetical protein V2O64_22570 [Verrucomicrobiaceae bacterium 227]
MKTLLLLSLTTFTSFGQVVQVPPKQIVPMDVQLRAKAAVQAQVEKTLQGDFKGVVEKMNPDHLKILAREMKVPVANVKARKVAQLQAIGQQGVVLEAMITLPPAGAFEVDYGFEDRIVDGKPVKVAGYRSWMVFIPTVMDISAMDRAAQPPRMRTIRKWSFEVAISRKKEEEWTFVNGDVVNALELRKLFKFLPQKDSAFNFPVKKAEEVERK